MALIGEKRIIKKTHQTLEGELADQQLSGLLVATNLTQSDGTGLVAVRLLDTSGRRGGLASGLGGELLTGSLATGGLAGSLLGTSHCDDARKKVMQMSKCCCGWMNAMRRDAKFDGRKGDGLMWVERV